MPINIRDAGTWKNVANIFVRDAGTWKTVQNGYVRDGGTWKEFYANSFMFSITANTSNVNLRTAAINAGWNQSSKLIVTINSGVIIHSTSTGTPALTVSGSFPGGVDLINNGTILGRGGDGGGGGFVSNGGAGGGGGVGLSVSSPISINNAGRISGGGGGGGGGSGFARQHDYAGWQYFAGGSGGGGIGNGSPNGTLTSHGSGYAGERGLGGTGGAGGTYGSSGASGASVYWNGGGGGGGGAAVVGNSNVTWIATGTRNGGIS